MKMLTCPLGQPHQSNDNGLQRSNSMDQIHVMNEDDVSDDILGNGSLASTDIEQKINFPDDYLPVESTLQQKHNNTLFWNQLSTIGSDNINVLFQLKRPLNDNETLVLSTYSQYAASYFVHSITRSMNACKVIRNKTLQDDDSDVYHFEERRKEIRMKMKRSDSVRGLKRAVSDLSFIPVDDEDAEFQQDRHLHVSSRKVYAKVNDEQELVMLSHRVADDDGNMLCVGHEVGMKPLNMKDFALAPCEQGLPFVIPFSNDDFQMITDNLSDPIKQRQIILESVVNRVGRNDCDELFMLSFIRLQNQDGVRVDVWFNTITKGEGVVHCNALNSKQDYDLPVASTDILGVFPEGVHVIFVKC